jgi:hypothetical protein
MSRSLASHRHLIRLVVFCILAAGLVSACSGGSSQQNVSPAGTPGTTPQGTGGVAFRLVWQPRSAKVKAMRTPAFNACVDNAIGTIAATVSSGTATVTSSSFPCAAHEGLILGVPVGTNFTVRVDGISSGATPTTTWSGQVSPITVTNGQITNAGTIVMSFIGTDTVQPTVISSGPNSNPTSTTNVPVSDRFTIAFDKPMAISTITSTNIVLMDTGTASPVPGIVSYVSASNAAAYTPSASLTPNTTYALQVTACVAASCIRDVSGNQLAGNYTNTLTTEAAAAGISAAPAGVTAVPGNGQVTLDWLAAAGATSYNVYYGTVSGVTPSTGTQVVGVQAPAVHLGVNNGSTYYYVVTAVNSFGESPASGQVSATPVFPGGNPLPPASLTVTPISGQNSIAWSAVTGATAYNLYWSTRPISPDKYSADNVIRGVTSPFTHTGLTNGLNYCYIVSALNANGESGDSMQACGGVGAIQIFW